VAAPTAFDNQTKRAAPKRKNHHPDRRSYIETDRLWCFLARIDGYAELSVVVQQVKMSCLVRMIAWLQARSPIAVGAVLEIETDSQLVSM
jgi:hypothetical protein